MKTISKKITIALFLLGGISLATVSAQTTVTTPCGVYKIDNVKKEISNVVTTGNATITTSSISSNVSVSSTTVNGSTTSKILVNGELYKEVTCKATKASLPAFDFKPLEYNPIMLPSRNDDWFTNLFSFFNF